MSRVKRDRDGTAFFSLLSDKITDAAKKALQDGATRVVEDARSRCPIRTGNLSNSIHMELRKEGKSIRIVADARADSDNQYYGKVVEFSPKINEPYLYPALDAERDTIKSDVINAIGEACRKEGGK